MMVTSSRSTELLKTLQLGLSLREFRSKCVISLNTADSTV
jgi:Fe2+ transport system protein B